MGEANMAYVHGDIPKALRICQEVITNGNLYSVLFTQINTNLLLNYLY